MLDNRGQGDQSERAIERRNDRDAKNSLRRGEHRQEDAAEGNRRDQVGDEYQLRIYHIDPDSAIGDMAALLLEMAESLRDCMRMLEHNPAQCNVHAVQVKKLENRLNARFHQAMNDLFEQEDLRAILKYREVYAHFNHASDKGDHAADILLDILVKS